MKRLVASMLGASLCAMAPAGSAEADDAYSYCNHYAAAAVRAGYMVRHVSACRHFIYETPWRWTLDYEQHFSWCVSVFGSGQNRFEREARAAELQECGAT